MTKLNLFDKNQPEDLPESFQLQRLGCKIFKINFLKLFLHLVLISTGILLLLGLIWRRSGLSIYSRSSLYFQYILRWALFDHLRCAPYCRSSWTKLLAPLYKKHQKIWLTLQVRICVTQVFPSQISPRFYILLRIPYRSYCIDDLRFIMNTIPFDLQIPCNLSFFQVP